MNVRFLIAGLALCVANLASAQGSPFATKSIKRPDGLIVIHAGRLLAVPGNEVLREQTVVVRNDKIVELQSGYVDPDDISRTDKESLTVLDLREHFVMPGLLDAHVHLARATGAYQPGLLQINASPSPGAAAVNALINARLTLAAGFTGVRDLGSDQESVFAVRDAINRGAFVGPHIVASGVSISVTGGHGDDVADQTADGRAAAGVCDGADECRTLVRQLEKTGSDLIKFKATGGFSSNTGTKQHMTAEEMRAIVAAAQLRDISVTVHAYDPDAILDALSAGVNSVEHAFMLDDRGISKMRKQGVFLVPTLTVAEPPGMVKQFLRGKEAISVVMRNEHQAFEKAYAAGVKIGFGTDAGIYPHGKNADEFVTMVNLGMTPADAIVSATVANAELFGLPGVTGIIESGAVADIIAVQGDPLTDIEALKEVDYVIKSGQIVKQAGQDVGCFRLRSQAQILDVRANRH